MEIYRKKEKSTPGFGYWGDFGEIDMGFSYGYVEKREGFSGEKRHYHKKGTVYFLTLEGRGSLEVDGEDVVMEKDILIRVDPGEIYKVKSVLETPFHWLAICTSKDPQEKVVLDE